MRVWGTEVELLAAASLLQIPVFTLIPHGNTYKRFRYNPMCEDRLTLPSQVPLPKQLFHLSHIELLNVQGGHYDCIMSKKEAGHYASLLSTILLTTTVLNTLSYL